MEKKKKLVGFCALSGPYNLTVSTGMFLRTNISKSYQVCQEGPNGISVIVAADGLDQLLRRHTLSRRKKLRQPIVI